MNRNLRHRRKHVITPEFRGYRGAQAAHGTHRARCREEAVAAVTRRYKAFLRKPFRIRSIMAAIEQAMPAGGGPCGAPDGAG